MPVSPKIVAYLIPEFPGQTHIWMWREIACLREWGVEVRMHSTRRPQDHERARHAFANDPEVLATQYLAPIAPGEAIAAAAWLATRPLRAAAATKLALSLPVRNEGGKRPATIKLLLPAAILARRLIAQRATHLHVHSAASSAVVAMLSHILGGPAYSLTLNADLGGWGGALFEKFERSAFTIAITQKLINEVNAELPPLSPGKLLLGRIGVDTRVNRPDPSVTRSGVVTVARLHPSKGHDTLIRAIGILRDRGITATLRIAGAGPQREELESLIRELKLGSIVTLLGSIGDAAVVSELQRAQVFALASHNEPLGVAYMEAMACGTPTIGTSAGGVREIIRDDVDGLLVPPKDEVALANAIERLLKDASLRERLSASGRQKIIDEFDSRIGAKTLYERVFGALESAQ